MKFNKHYCQQCHNGINNAVANVPSHVVPKECFVTYHGNDTWATISGTGCAHWVAHELRITKGTVRCIDDKTVRVPELIQNTTTIDRANVRRNDIWAQADRAHCGIVISVVPKAGSPPNTITIRHDSSSQGGVVDNDFDTHFHGNGSFHR